MRWAARSGRMCCAVLVCHNSTRCAGVHAHPVPPPHDSHTQRNRRLQGSGVYKAATVEHSSSTGARTHTHTHTHTHTRSHTHTVTHTHTQSHTTPLPPHTLLPSPTPHSHHTHTHPQVPSPREREAALSALVDYIAGATPALPALLLVGCEIGERGVTVCGQAVDVRALYDLVRGCVWCQ